MPSKFPDHACKFCGIMIKKDDPINKVPAGHWCSNPKCPEPMESSGTEPTPGPAAKDTEPTPDKLKKDFEKFVTTENFVLSKIEEIVEKEMQAANSAKGGPINGQKVGMHVKEIYRTWTNQQWKLLEHGLD